MRGRNAINDSYQKQSKRQSRTTATTAQYFNLTTLRIPINYSEEKKWAVKKEQNYKADSLTSSSCWAAERPLRFLGMQMSQAPALCTDTYRNSTTPTRTIYHTPRIHTHIHMYVHIAFIPAIHATIHMYITEHTYIDYMHIHTYIYIYVHVHTHIHICIHIWWWTHRFRWRQCYCGWVLEWL